MINQFVKAYKFLSNFYSLPIEIDGKSYPTVEHYYQAMKAIDSGQQEWIRIAKTPGLAKSLGKCCNLREDWEEIKFEVMERGLRAKFEDITLLQCLVLTDDEELIEGNNWGDTIWGVDLKTGRGENHLGKLLMKIRDEVE